MHMNDDMIFYNLRMIKNNKIKWENNKSKNVKKHICMKNKK